MLNCIQRPNHSVHGLQRLVDQLKRQRLSGVAPELATQWRRKWNRQRIQRCPPLEWYGHLPDANLVAAIESWSAEHQRFFRFWWIQCDQHWQSDGDRVI